MIIKLKHGLAGDFVSFLPRQVIKVSEETGKRFVERGMAEEMPKGTATDGELKDEHPDPEVQAAGEKQKAEDEKMEKRRAAEKAVAPEHETPETTRAAAAESSICHGQTTQGNACARKAKAGSAYCDKHGG